MLRRGGATIDDGVTRPGRTGHAADVEPRRILMTQQEERALLAQAFKDAAPSEGVLRVLEAGCGQKWTVDVPDVKLHITGVDADPEALRMRREQQGDLDEGIHADLRSVELPKDAFDVAYCAFVLEHVEGAEQVLDRLTAAVRPGGRLILLLPNGHSIVGFAAKHFPFWVHIVYKKYIEGFKDAGKPGHAPYPTVYDPVVSLAGIREYARAHNLTIVEEYGIDYVLQNFGRYRGAVRMAFNGFATASRNRLSPTHNNLGFVLQRPSMPQD